jgi:hypothetical protein
MTFSSSCTLEVAVDADLSAGFDGLISGAAARTSPVSAVFTHIPPRTDVHARRRVNAVAQTVVLSLHPHCERSVPAEGAVLPPPFERDVYVVVLLDVQQVPPLLSTATVHRCPLHPSGAGPFGWYLDAVVDGVMQERVEELKHQEGEKGTGEGGGSTGASPTTSTATSMCVPGPVVRLSLIVVPNAAASLDGLNSTNTNISSKEASTLFSAAAAWCAARQLISAAGVVSSETDDARDRKNDACGELRTVAAAAAATIDLCTTAAQPQHAVQMIAALGTKLLKNWSTSVTMTAMPLAGNRTSLTSAATANMRDVRPDTQRKCVPTDFHALYTSMLTEVSSFSERKTIAAVTAFPTMCHLLEYVDSVTTPAVRHPSSSTDAGASTTAVYSTNYGEQRSWNVLNDAIVDALVTEYEPS